MASGNSYLEVEFQCLWNYYFPAIPLEQEVKLIPKRRFRFDFVHPQSKTAIEINGGIHSRMGHSSGKGINRDYEKLNLAIANGYIVFQLSSDMITHEWANIIKETICERLTNVNENQHKESG